MLFSKTSSISLLLWASSCQWQTMNPVGTDPFWPKTPLNSIETRPIVDHQSRLCKSPSNIILLIFNCLLPRPSSIEVSSSWKLLQYKISNSSLGPRSDQDTFTLCQPASLHLSYSSSSAWLQPEILTLDWHRWMLSVLLKYQETPALFRVQRELFVLEIPLRIIVGELCAPICIPILFL